MSRPTIVNRSGTVIVDGKQLYGMDAELHFKMLAKQDPEWEKKVAQWVSEVTGDKVDQLFESLADGVTLIKLVNTLKPGTIDKWNRIDPNNPKSHALAATGNIRLYLVAAQKLGVPGVDMFLVDDLRTGRGIQAVCRNLASLSRVAVRDHGWTGPALGPRASVAGPKKWEDVEYAPYRTVEEATPQSELEEMLMMYKGLLEKEREELVQAMTREAHMKHEVEKMRRQVKQYRMEVERQMEEAAEGGVAGLMRAAQALQSDPHLPEHLQPVEKSDRDEVEERQQRRAKKLQSLAQVEKKSSDALAEWQKKADKVKRKNEIKRQRRLSFTATVDSPQEALLDGQDVEDDDEDQEGPAEIVVVDGGAEDDEGVRRRRGSRTSSPSSREPDTPSKRRHVAEGRFGRKMLIAVIVVESLIIAGLGAAFAWYALH